LPCLRSSGAGRSGTTTKLRPAAWVSLKANTPFGSNEEMDLVENQHGRFHRTQESFGIGDALGGAGEIATQVQSLVQAAPASSCHPGARLTARQSVRDSRHAGASRPRRVAGLLYPDFMFGRTICKVCLRLPNQHPKGSGTIDLGGGLHDGRRASWASCSSHSASAFSA
jgi:hypothetical protein